MIKIFLLLTFVFIIGCEDKVTEPTTKYVTTPSICPPSNPETEPSNINFSGLKEVSEITKTAAKLSWEHKDGISHYSVLEVGKRDRKIVSIVSGPNNNYRLKGLLPDTQYTFLIRAMDLAGHIDTNTSAITFRTLPWPNFSNQRSLQLNGAQNISLASSDKFNIHNDFTVTLWIKTPNESHSDSRLITFHKGDLASSAFSLGLKGKFVKIHYTDKEGNLKSISENFEYYDGAWHQLVVSHNGKYITLFINGKRVLRTKDNISSFGKHPASIGSYTGIQKAYSGKIDEVAIFNSNFNNRQVTELFNSGIPMDFRSHSKGSKLIHWYQLGDQASDSATNIEDNIGELNGIPMNISTSDFSNDSP
jgi:hypothetical protein